MDVYRIKKIYGAAATGSRPISDEKLCKLLDEKILKLILLSDSLYSTVSHKLVDSLLEFFTKLNVALTECDTVLFLSELISVENNEILIVCAFTDHTDGSNVVKNSAISGSALYLKKSL